MENAVTRARGAEIQEYLDGRKTAFISFIEDLTLLESPSSVPSVQNRVRGIIADRLRSLGFLTLTLSGRNNGGNLYARPKIRR